MEFEGRDILPGKGERRCIMIKKRKKGGENNIQVGENKIGQVDELAG